MEENCNNKFNAVHELFGDEGTRPDLLVSPCFRTWFVASGVELDLEQPASQDLMLELAESITNQCVEGLCEDTWLVDWLSTWEVNGCFEHDSAAAIKHLQLLVLYGLSNWEPEDANPGPRYHYSFCVKDWKEDGTIWHCPVCGVCRDNETENWWHCKFHECVEGGNESVCEECHYGRRVY